MTIVIHCTESFHRLHKFYCCSVKTSMSVKESKRRWRAMERVLSESLDRRPHCHLLSLRSHYALEEYNLSGSQ